MFPCFLRFISMVASKIFFTQSPCLKLQTSAGIRSQAMFEKGKRWRQSFDERTTSPKAQTTI
ncbi:MAG: hypothetical protein RMM53_06290, partial [Bacteroidia bacterium]|nr:hypothetical protein [Bacteroidia bacterium]